MIEWFDDLVLGMRFKSPEKRVTREETSSGLHLNSIPKPTILTRRPRSAQYSRALRLPAGTPRRSPCGYRSRRVHSGRTPCSGSAWTNYDGSPQCTRTMSSIWKARLSSSRRHGQNRKGSSRSNGPRSISAVSRSTRLLQSALCPVARPDRLSLHRIAGEIAHRRTVYGFARDLVFSVA